jgi:hypothetical protein
MFVGINIYYMKYLKYFESIFSGDIQEISRKDWEDLQLSERDEFGILIKLTPIPLFRYKEIEKIADLKNYLALRDSGYIQMFGLKPNKNFLMILYFEPENDDPYYLLRFSTDNTVPQRLQIENGSLSYYVSDDFEGVKNFCKTKL